MRRLIQRKEPLKQRSRSARRKSDQGTAEIPSNVTATLPETTGERPSETTVAAAASEESLSVVVAEMALWGAAMSALVVPIGMMTVLASPFAVARDYWREAKSRATAHPVAA